MPIIHAVADTPETPWLPLQLPDSASGVLRVKRVGRLVILEALNLTLPPSIYVPVPPGYRWDRTGLTQWAGGFPLTDSQGHPGPALLRNHFTAEARLGQPVGIANGYGMHAYWTPDAMPA